jgi:hypothetical protein
MALVLLAAILYRSPVVLAAEFAPRPLRGNPLASSTAGLECVLTANPGPVSVGQEIRLELTVSNAGLPVTRLWFATPYIDSIGFSPRAGMASGASMASFAGPADPAGQTPVPPAPGSASVESGPAVRPVTLAAGESVTLTWTATARAAGPVRWTVSVGGLSVTLGRPVLSGTLVSNETVIETPPALSAVIRVSPPDPCSGRGLTAVMEIANSGQASVTSLAPSVSSASGAGGVVMPFPGAILPPAYLPGGGTVTFTLTLTAGSPGIVFLSATLTGTDANSGAPVAVTASSGPVEIFAPGELSLATSVRTVASRGQWVAVSLTVTNTGGYRITGLAPLLTVSGSGAEIRRPSPDQPELKPGASRIFRWTWSVAGTGEYEFTVSVTGFTCDAVPLAATSCAIMEAVPPAALSGSLVVSSENVVSGQWVKVTLTVSDTGGAPARFVRPAGIESSAGAFRTGGPEPRAVEDLPKGGSAVFTWTYSMTGSGPAGFSAIVAAKDAFSGLPVASPVIDSPKVQVLTVALLAIDSVRLMPNPVVTAGAFVTACVVVVNKGDAPAEITELAIKKEEEKGGSALNNPTIMSPRLPLTIAGGEVRTVVWSYRAGTRGKASVKVTATLKESATGRKFKSDTVQSNWIKIGTVVSATATRGSGLGW